MPSLPFAKDTFYRFMNSCSVNWRKFTLQLGFAVIHKIAPLTDESRRNVLIIDDSLFSRSRSKKVELLAKVYDHVEHKYTKGFRMLTLGWSDGNSSVIACFPLPTVKTVCRKRPLALMPGVMAVSNVSWHRLKQPAYSRRF